MSRIDIAELTEFLHNLKKSNEEARTMLKNIQTAAEEYSTDTSLKGKAVTASQTYFQETYPVLCKTLIEALNESEDRLEQYIREFGEQVDPSPNSRVDAQLLQEAMDRLAEIKRKQEDLLLRMSAGTGTLYEGQQQNLRTQFTDAIEQENILERYIAFEQSHANFFDSLNELVYRANKAIQELADHVTFNSQTGTYGLEKLDTTRFEALQELLPKKKKYNFNEYEIRYNGATHILLKNGIVDVEATNAYNEAIFNGELDKVSNQATESAEAIKAVVAALKKGRDPITGQKISKAQSFGIIAGLVYMYAGGRYKGRKIKIPKSALENLEKGKVFKDKKASGLNVPKLSSLSKKQQLKLANTYKKKAPVSIPDDAKIKAQTKKAGYEQIIYKWNDGQFKYEVRWHTRTPDAPVKQGNTWVVQRTVPGNGGNKPQTFFKIGDNEWIEGYKWYEAINARKAGNATSEQIRILDKGHWKE
ncbi:T7SS effector LXG polymorphic toxin [Listeria ivanovii]|uniref:T7SS effector LXG polymorphic toxin n=1 Tax=Listeria ivanovii TaxID=1638 RepID=UPI003CEC3D94